MLFQFSRQVNIHLAERFPSEKISLCMKFSTQAGEKTNFERSKVENLFMFMNAQILPTNTKEINRYL